MRIRQVANLGDLRCAADAANADISSAIMWETTIMTVVALTRLLRSSLPSSPMTRHWSRSSGDRALNRW